MCKKVLVVATSRKTHGGISTVLKSFESGEVWKKYHCKWVEAHIDGSALKKIGYMISGYFQYLYLLPLYDIVHVHMSAGISAKRKIGFVALAKLLKKPVVVHLHCGNQVEDSWSQQMTYIFTKADVGLVLSKSIKEAVVRKTGKRDNLQVCYNPAPTVQYKEGTPRKKYILYTGTIGKNKGYHILIEAFAKVAHKFPDWSVMIAGVGEIEEANKQIKKHGLENQIKMLGWINGELRDTYYKEASIFCLPSFMEGFPMSVLEAWAYGVPVVATPVGGIPDVAVDGENMLLFRIGDSEDLAEKLSKLMSDENLRERISKKSLELANGKFSLMTILDQLDYIYSSL